MAFAQMTLLDRAHLLHVLRHVSEQHPSNKVHRQLQRPDWSKTVPRVPRVKHTSRSKSEILRPPLEISRKNLAHGRVTRPDWEYFFSRNCLYRISIVKHAKNTLKRNFPLWYWSNFQSQTFKRCATKMCNFLCYSSLPESTHGDGKIQNPGSKVKKYVMYLDFQDLLLLCCEFPWVHVNPRVEGFPMVK